MPPLLVALLLLLAAPPAPVSAHSSYPGSCSALSGHGGSSSPGAGGHVLALVSGDPAPGARVVVRLDAPAGSAGFKGFLVRASGSAALAPKSADSGAASRCANAVGHVSSSLKTSVEAYLDVPADAAPGDVVLLTAQALPSKLTVFVTTLDVTVTGSSSPPSPSPPPSPPLAVPNPTGCAPEGTALGYACEAALAKDVFLHWTAGGWTDTFRGVDETAAVVVPALGRVRFALVTTRENVRAASVSFQQTAAMVPAIAVGGWIGDEEDGGAGSYSSVSAFEVTGYGTSSVTDHSSVVPLTDASVESSSTSAAFPGVNTRRVFTVKFELAIADAGVERWFDGSSSSSFVGFALATGARDADANGRARLRYHDALHGAVTIDFLRGGGGVQSAAVPGSARIKAHATLMSVGWGMILLGSLVAAFGKNNKRKKKSGDVSDEDARGDAAREDDASEEEGETTRGGGKSGGSSRDPSHRVLRTQEVTGFAEERRRPSGRPRVDLDGVPECPGPALFFCPPEEAGNKAAAPYSQTIIWFHLHRVLQTVGLVLVVAAFGLALDRGDAENTAREPFAYSGDGWALGTRRGDLLAWHGALGLVATLLAPTQVLLALLREGKNTTNKTPRRDAHVLLGWVATALAFAAAWIGSYVMEEKLGKDASEGGDDSGYYFRAYAVAASTATVVAVAARVWGVASRRRRDAHAVRERFEGDDDAARR